MRVGQPSGSAGGFAHSGKSGEESGGGDFLAHLDRANPLHTRDGRLRITVVRARNFPNTVLPPPAEDGVKTKKRKTSGKIRDRDPGFVSLHFLELNNSGSVVEGWGKGSGGVMPSVGDFMDGGGEGRGAAPKDMPWEDDGGYGEWESEYVCVCERERKEVV